MSKASNLMYIPRKPTYKRKVPLYQEIQIRFNEQQKYEEESKRKMIARSKQVQNLIGQRPPVLKSPSPPKYIDPVRSIIETFKDVTPLRKGIKRSTSRSPE